MNDEVEKLKKRVSQLEKIVGEFYRSDRFYFSRNLYLPSRVNIVCAGGEDDGEGTMIGTNTSQRIGFYGVYPVPQQENVPAPDFITLGGTYSASDLNTNFSRAMTAFEGIIGDLINLGLMSD